MKDVSPRHPQLVLEVQRRVRLDARMPVPVAQHAVLDRLREDAVERGDRRLERGRARLLRIGHEQPRGHVQREHRQRVDPGLAQRGPEDARIGERVTVRLARWRLGDRATRGFAVRALELRGALVDVERPRERAHRIDLAIPQRGQAREEQVDLQLRALGRRRLLARGGRRTPHEAPELGGRDTREHVTRAHSPLGAGDGAVERHLYAVASGLDPQHLDTRSQRRAGLVRRPCKRVGHGAHAADRDLPFARAAADDVVEEAAVLDELPAAGRRERADERVG